VLLRIVDEDSVFCRRFSAPMTDVRHGHNILVITPTLGAYRTGLLSAANPAR
jgi:hypothetical protein